MEADDSAINVPAIAAAHVIKRYVAQAPDEISLEVYIILCGIISYSIAVPRISLHSRTRVSLPRMKALLGIDVARNT